MRNIPERIFLNIQEECMEEFEDFEELVRVGGVTWSEHNIYGADVEYVRKQSPWISAKESLPNNQDIVLVRDNQGRVSTAYLHGKTSGFITYGEDAYNEFGKITHWMPMPEFNK